MTVISMVVGATTDDGATFVAKVTTGPVRVAVADNLGMTSPVFTGSQAVDAQGVAKVSITGLNPLTRYWWQVEDNSVIDDTITGQFITHPTVGTAASFTIAVAGDAGGPASVPGNAGTELAPDRISNHEVFETIRSRAVAGDWLSFVHLGDLHYYDLGSGSHGIVGGGSLANYRTSYDDIMLQPNQHALYHEVPWIYVWDDHDYGPNDSDGTLATKANAADAYRERVPHYPLSDSDGIWQEWVIGRVQFIAFDVRYYRDPNSDTPGPTKTMLGSAQKAWLESILSTTTAEGLVLFTSSQWLHPSGIDTWASFADERAEIVDMLDQYGWLDRMVMAYADRHALGITGGGTNPYGSFPVIQAAALDSPPGGSPNPSLFDVVEDTPGLNQYGTITVHDSGTVIGIELQAWQGSTSLGSYTLSIVLPTPPTPLPSVVNLLSGSHNVVFEATILEDYQTGDEPSGTSFELHDGGEVVIDGTRDIRGTAKLRFPGTFGQDGRSTFPRGRSRLFAPFGNEVFIRYGIDLGPEVLWIPLGYYRLTTTDQDDSPFNPISVTCEDRMATIIDSDLLSPRAYDPPATVGDVFDDLILDVYPDATIEFDDATGTIPLARQVVAEKNRFKPLQELADAFGKIVYWNDVGILRIESLPDPSQIAWNVKSGRNGVLVNAKRRLSRKEIFNAVVVEGEGADSDNPVRAVAYDNDPNSPTFFGGRFGRVPFFMTTPLVTTYPQALNAALILLRRQAIGAPFEMDFEAITNPTLRPFQTVRVIHNNNDRDVHVVNSVRIPLDEDDTMSADTRERVVMIVGSA